MLRWVERIFGREKRADEVSLRAEIDAERVVLETRQRRAERVIADLHRADRVIVGTKQRGRNG